MQVSDTPAWNDQDVCDRVIAHMQEAVIVVDRNEIVRLWNPGAEKLFGYAAHEALGRNLDLIVPERLRQAHSSGFRKAVDTGHTKYDGKVMTTRSTHKNGNKIYVDLSFALLRDDTGAIMGVSAVARDCTASYLAAQASRATSGSSGS
nr:PAS domain S-box protein [Pseudomonas sp.]